MNKSLKKIENGQNVWLITLISTVIFMYKNNV